MNKNCSTTTDSFVEPGSLWTILKTEKRWYLCGAVFVFLLASVLISGWPQGLIPNTAYPYAYSGDSLGYSWLIQRAMEGWVFENPRNGYPFGSNFLDYPGSDAGTLVLLKLIGFFAGSFYATFNLYFLLSFSLIFISTYLVLRSLDLCKPLSSAAALIYAFLPFHFLRLGHYFFISYFVAPLFFYAAMKILFQDTERFLQRLDLKTGLLYGLIFITLASFGVYYALFGTILMAAASLIRFCQPKGLKSALVGLCAVGLIILGVLLNTTPNIVYKKMHGPNAEVMHRNAAEAELYGLKMTQLLLPRQGHRIESWANFSNRYNQNTPLVNENISSSLGILGSIGFLLAGFVLVKLAAGLQPDRRLVTLAGLVSLLFLFGTIGGLGSLFSMVISSSIRGWNRISIFIGFGTIALFFIALQLAATRYLQRSKNWGIYLSAILLSGLAIFDQTSPTCLPCNQLVKDAFDSDKSFISQVEASLPEGSALYQLPYMPFPEGSQVYKMDSYDILEGFLHSQNLRWNLGGMKGRAGDQFYKTLATESLEDQLEIIKKLGFAGVFIDRRGFVDYGVSIVNELTSKLGYSATLENKKFAFFKLPEPASSIKNKTPDQLIASVGYIGDFSSSSELKNFQSAMLFSQPELPSYVKELNGLSSKEPWGRWSDANLSPSVLIRFHQPLPSKFNLVLNAKSFTTGPKEIVRIRVGSKNHEAHITTAFSQINVPINLGNETVDLIELIPEKSESPSAMGLGGDSRKLGIGLVSMQIQTSKGGGFVK